jgi:hypothetical protein
LTSSVHHHFFHLPTRFHNSALDLLVLNPRDVSSLTLRAV